MAFRSSKQKKLRELLLLVHCNPDKVFKETGFILASNTDEQIKAETQYIRGVSLLKLAKFKDSITPLQEAANFLEEKNQELYGMVLVSLSEAFARTTRIDNAYHLADIAEKTLRKIDINHTSLAALYNNRAVIHLVSAAYIKAFDGFSKAEKLYQFHSNKLGLQIVYLNKAKIAYELKDYESASEFSKKCIDVGKKLPLNQNHATIYTILGACSLMNKEFKKACKHFLKSIKLYGEVGIDLGLDLAKLNLACAYSFIGKGKEALLISKKIHEKFIAYNNSQLFLHSHHTIARSFSSLEKHQEAYKHYKKSYMFAVQIGNDAYKAENLERLSFTCEEMGNYPAALSYIKDYHSVKLNLFVANNLKLLQMDAGLRASKGYDLVRKGQEQATPMHTFNDKKIAIHNILYFERKSLQKGKYAYTTVYFWENGAVKSYGKKPISLEEIKRLLNPFSPRKFVKINANYLINPSQIKEIHRTYVIMLNKQRLKVSPRMLDNIIGLLNYE